MSRSMYHLMFGVLWTMLLLQIAFHNSAVYSILTGSITKETSRVAAESEDIVNRYGELGAQAHHSERMTPYYQQMTNVRRRCRMTIRYLDAVSNHIAEAAGGYLPNSLGLRYPDDRKWRRKVFRAEEDVQALLHAVDSLNEYFVRTINPGDYPDDIRKNLPSKWCDCNWHEQGPGRKEMQRFFHNSSATAAVAMLTAIKHNIILSEKLILQALYRWGMPTIHSFDAVTGFSWLGAYHFVPGQVVTGRISLMAYRKRALKGVVAHSGRITNVQNGIATWKDKARNTGKHRVSGSISFEENTGTRTLPWTFVYRSGNPYANLELDKMNVVYRGIHNPVTISCAAGYGLQDLSVHIAGATVVQTGAGQFNILTNSRKKKLYALIIHSGNGNIRDTLGGLAIRLKNLPRPIATIGETTKGRIAADELHRTRLRVINPDEDHVPPYSLISCTLRLMKKARYELSEPIVVDNANYWNQTDVRQLLQDAAKGDRIFFTNISATAPDGMIVNPADLVYLIE